MLRNSDLVKSTKISLAMSVLNDFEKAHFLNLHVPNNNFFFFNSDINK